MWYKSCDWLLNFKSNQHNNSCSHCRLVLHPPRFWKKLKDTICIIFHIDCYITVNITDFQVWICSHVWFRIMGHFSRSSFNACWKFVAIFFSLLTHYTFHKLPWPTIHALCDSAQYWLVNMRLIIKLYKPISFLSVNNWRASSHITTV